MLAASLGAHTWLERSITVTKRVALFAGFVIATAFFQAVATEPVERLVSDLHSINADISWPSPSDLRAACGNDRKCYAEFIVNARPDDIGLIQVVHPDTDTIRWVRTHRSAEHSLEDHGPYIRIDGFGRKVIRDVTAALDAFRSSHPNVPIRIDLSKNSGGDFERMLEVAGLLVGSQKDAVIIDSGSQETWRDLDARQQNRSPLIASVRIGQKTASSAEVLAALLHRYGGAILCGDQRTAGQAIQKRLVAVDHDIRLVVKAAYLGVPPINITDGLLPQKTCDY